MSFELVSPKRLLVQVISAADGRSIASGESPSKSPKHRASSSPSRAKLQSSTEKVGPPRRQLTVQEALADASRTEGRCMVELQDLLACPGWSGNLDEEAWRSFPEAATQQLSSVSEEGSSQMNADRQMELAGQTFVAKVGSWSSLCPLEWSAEPASYNMKTRRMIEGQPCCPTPAKPGLLTLAVQCRLPGANQVTVHTGRLAAIPGGLADRLCHDPTWPPTEQHANHEQREPAVRLGLSRQHPDALPADCGLHDGLDRRLRPSCRYSQSPVPALGSARARWPDADHFCIVQATRLTTSSAIRKLWRGVRILARPANTSASSCTP